MSLVFHFSPPIPSWNHESQTWTSSPHWKSLSQGHKQLLAKCYGRFSVFVLGLSAAFVMSVTLTNAFFPGLQGHVSQSCSLSVRLLCWFVLMSPTLNFGVPQRSVLKPRFPLSLLGNLMQTRGFKIYLCACMLLKHKRVSLGCGWNQGYIHVQ